jgi:LCP family protein required for cell wall assembly
MPKESSPTNRPDKGRPSPRPARKPARKSARPGGRSKVKTFFAYFTLVVLAALAGFSGFIFKQVRESKSLGSYIGSFLHPKTHADVFPGREAINLLVIGRDYDYNDKDQVIKTRARSDMLMAGRIDFVHNTVSLLSIPRDTRAEIPGHGVGKINGAHARGGPELTAETVKKNFGIPTDKYVALDFQGFEKAIDLLGGVDLTVDKKMDYDDNWGHLHIHLKPGPQHLDGQQAMGFVRFRHSDSDLVRVQRQQALLAAIKLKLFSPATLAKIPTILDTIDRHIDSDLTVDQKVVLAEFIKSIPHEQLKMTTLPSNETNGPFVVTDWSKARPLIQETFALSPSDIPSDTPSSTRPGRHRRHRRHSTRVAELP